MAAQCIASRLHEFLRGRDEGEIVDRIRREVKGDLSPQDRPRLRAADLLLQAEAPRIFVEWEGRQKDSVPGSYRLLEPEEDRQQEHHTTEEETPNGHLRR